MAYGKTTKKTKKPNMKKAIRQTNRIAKKTLKKAKKGK